MDQKKIAVDLFLAGVERVKPSQLIRNFVRYEKEVLKIKELTYDLRSIENLYVIGAGKASALMAREIESILSDRISGGHIITKYEHGLPLQSIEITEASHPVPDLNGVRGTAEILKIAEKAGKNDLVICLLSGGGSALMTDLPDGCSLDDLMLLNDVLLKSGADIQEMNCIRKHLSGVKGGFLSKAVWPAEMVSLILSDVIGDPLDVIASGPSSPDPTTYSDALAVLKKYGIEKQVSHAVLRYLESGAQRMIAETPKPNDQIFSTTRNLIIGNIHLALEAAKKAAEGMGYHAQIITDSLRGDVNDVIEQIFKIVRSIKELNSKEGICLLFGGEPTLRVNEKGKGGRNQHLTLLASKQIREFSGITFLSAGTDGTDGPTDAAGAVIDSEKVKTYNEQDIDHFLKTFDSYNFFNREGGLIITGPTRTNVMDMVIVLIEPK